MPLLSRCYVWIYPLAFISFKIYFAPCWKQIEVRYIFQLFSAIQSTNAFAKHLSPKEKLQQKIVLMSKAMSCIVLLHNHLCHANILEKIISLKLLCVLWNSEEMHKGVRWDKYILRIITWNRKMMLYDYQWVLSIEIVFFLESIWYLYISVCIKNTSSPWKKAYNKENSMKVRS